MTLRFKAPQRHYIPTRIDEAGVQLFGSQPWTVETVIEARKAGAWFGNSGDHDFASREVAIAAHKELAP